MTNLLGIPDTIEGWWDIARRVRARRGRSLDSLIRQGQWEERVSAQYGRWPLRSPHGREPMPYVPCDVLLLRTLAAGMDLGLGLPDPSQAPSYRGGLAALVLDAMPFWLPARTAQGIAHSEPPAVDMLDDLRLPYEKQAVWFAAPALLGPASDVMNDIVRASVRSARGPGRKVRLDIVPWELVVGAAPLVSADPLDAPASQVQVSIEGVVLTSDAEGHPSDLMAWIVSAKPPASDVRSRPIRCVLPAWRSQSEFGSVVANLMAVIAWGDWQMPNGEMQISPGIHRRELRAWLRRNDPSSLGPVRVLSAPVRAARTVNNEPPVGGHASPVTHLRRGHWRRQWLPSLEDHRPTWIPPVLVNPSGVDDPQIIVWRLPERHPEPSKNERMKR